VVESSRNAQDGIRARVGGVWTKEKLVYVRKYASGFMTAMAPKRAAGKWEQLVYIDPLCGPGIDIDRITGEQFSGSPLIALATQPKFDRVFLGDKNRLNVAALRRRIPAGDEGRVSLERRDCHERVRDVMAEISTRTLGLAFIDPEGFEVKFELFRTLARRAVDVVFLFPSGIGFARNLRQFAQTRDCVVDDMWGSRAWRETPLVRLLAGGSAAATSIPNGEALALSWANAFCQRVVTLGYEKFDSVGPLCNEQNVPMYHLLFFSKSQAGLTIWRGISKIDARGQRQLPM
jgi:three-Cys-motif partner protein